MRCRSAGARKKAAAKRTFMKHIMLVNAVHKEQRRMATVNEKGILVDFNIETVSYTHLTLPTIYSV